MRISPLHEKILVEFEKLTTEPFKHILPENALRILAHLHQIHIIKNEHADKVIPQLLEQLTVSSINNATIIIQFESYGTPHYASLHVISQKSICIFIDASTPSEHFPGFIRKLRKHFNHIYTIVGDDIIDKIQLDSKSCPIFSYYYAQLFVTQPDLIEQLIKISVIVTSFSTSSESTSQISTATLLLKKINDFEGDTPIHNVKGTVYLATWKQLSPEYIRHIQSLSAAYAYIRYHESSLQTSNYAKTMSAFLEKQVEAFTIHGESKPRNLGILKYCEELIKFLSLKLVGTTAEELATIVCPGNDKVLLKHTNAPLFDSRSPTPAQEKLFASLFGSSVKTREIKKCLAETNREQQSHQQLRRSLFELSINIATTSAAAARASSPVDAEMELDLGNLHNHL